MAEFKLPETEVEAMRRRLGEELAAFYLQLVELEENNAAMSGTVAGAKEWLDSLSKKFNIYLPSAVKLQRIG